MMEALVTTAVIWAIVQFVLSGLMMAFTAGDFKMYDYDRTKKQQSANRFRLATVALVLSPFGILTLPALILYSIFLIGRNVVRTTVTIFNWEA